MKKISALFMGLIIALGVFAVPQNLQQRTTRMMRAHRVAPTAHKVVKHNAPTATSDETINVVCQDLEVDASWLDYTGMVLLYGSNKEYSVIVYLIPDEEATDYYGDYSTAAENIMLGIYLPNDDEEELTVSSASFKQTKDGDVFTAVGVDEKGRTFNISLTLVVPDAKDTVKVTITEPVTYEYYGESEDYYIYGENEGKFAVTLDIYTEQMAGSYKDEDFEPEYTQIYLINGKDTAAYSFYSISAEITEKDGVGTIIAKGLAKDTLFYEITMHYDVVVAKTTVELAIDNAALIDYTADYGMYQVSGTKDGVMISITPMAKQLAGKFTYKDLSGTYSFVKAGEEYYGFVGGEFTATVDNNVLTLQGELLATNCTLYKFVIKSAITGIENFKADKNGTVKFVENGQMYILRDGKTYNMLGAEVR